VWLFIPNPIIIRMMEPREDEYYMRQALTEASRAAEQDEVPVGAIVVASGTIIARAHNLTETLGDPTAHAEMQAITAAASYLGGKYLTDCTIYVTVEPCVMCAGALAWSQVATLVYGAGDPKKGFTTVNSPLLHPKTIVRNGVMEEECSEMMKKFFRKKRK
jgi:tRNA(adenine34) deaminase